MNRPLLVTVKLSSVPTPAGLAMAGVVSILALAAFNTGNNLLYLLLSGSLGLWVAEWLLGRSNLVGLSLRVPQAPEGVVGEPLAAEAWARKSGRFPALSIVLEPAQQPGCTLLRLRPGVEQILHLPLRYRQRGAFPLGPARISSTFPFGWVRRSRSAALDAIALALPQPLPPEREIQISGGRDGGSSGIGEQAGDLAEYRPGDDSRWLHWPTSARIGRLIVQKPLGGTTRPETVVLRTRGRPNGDPAAELAIRHAAGLSQALLRRGSPVRMVGPGIDLGPGEGARFSRAILRALALLDTMAPDPPADKPGWEVSADAVQTETYRDADQPNSFAARASR